jgi:hypothetical protein
LALLVARREIWFLASVADGDHVSGLVDAALLGLLVGSSSVAGVGIDWIEIGLLNVSSSAVRSVDRIEEVVQEPSIGVVGLVDWIVGLKEDGLLGVYAGCRTG